jgi:hypothetical protein
VPKEPQFGVEVEGFALRLSFGVLCANFGIQERELFEFADVFPRPIVNTDLLLFEAKSEGEEQEDEHPLVSVDHIVRMYIQNIFSAILFSNGMAFEIKKWGWAAMGEVPNSAHSLGEEYMIINVTTYNLN